MAFFVVKIVGVAIPRGVRYSAFEKNYRMSEHVVLLVVLLETSGAVASTFFCLCFPASIGRKRFWRLW